MFAIKAVLLLSFLSVWLRMNRKNMNKHCYLNSARPVLLELKLRNLLLLLLLCGDIALNRGQTYFRFGNCGFIHIKGSLIHDFIK